MPEMILDDGWVVTYGESGTGEPIVLVLGSAESEARASSIASMKDVGHRLLFVAVDALADDGAMAARRLRELLAGAGLRAVTLVGHARGCAVAARVAARDDGDLVARLALVSSPVNLPAAADTAATDYSADLGRVSVPILVMHSEVDAEAPLQEMAMGAVFAAPHARLRVYPGLLDGLREEYREAVIRDILAFAAEPVGGSLLQASGGSGADS